MGKLKKEFEALLIMYRTLRDTEEILDSVYFDTISYDIEGYEETLYEIGNDFGWLEEETEKLRAQVSAVSQLVIAMKKLDFRYS
jgi:hypothetical protein